MYSSLLESLVVYKTLPRKINIVTSYVTCGNDTGGVHCEMSGTMVAPAWPPTTGHVTWLTSRPWKQQTTNNNTPAEVQLTDDLQPVAELPGRRRLRSSSTSALAVPQTRLRTIGDRAFPIAAHGTVCLRKWRHHEHSHLLYLNWKHIYLNCLFLLPFHKWLKCCCSMHLKYCIISSYHIIHASTLNSHSS